MHLSFGQTPSGNELLGLNTVASADLINISNPVVGSLLYNPTDEKIYVYTGSSGWVQTGSGGSATDISFNSANGKLTLSAPATPGNEVDLSSYVRLAPIKEVLSNYTLQATDTGHVLKVNSSTDVTITVPSGLPTGFNISIYQYGTGIITFNGSGTTLFNRSDRFKTAGQHAGVGIVCMTTNEFHLVGDLKK